MLTKYSYCIKTVAFIVVSIFFFNALAWAYPDYRDTVHSRDKLSVESIFKPLVDQGITVSAAMRFEVLAGLRLFQKGMTVAAVNGCLVETQAGSASPKEPSVEFISGDLVSEAEVRASFRAISHKDLVFDVDYKIGYKNGELSPETQDQTFPVEDMAPGELTALNVFGIGDKIIITLRGEGQARQDAVAAVASPVRQDIERYYLDIVKPALSEFRDKARSGKLNGDDLLDWVNKCVKPFAQGIDLTDLGLSGKKAGVKEFRQFIDELTNRAFIRMGLFLTDGGKTDLLPGEILSSEDVISAAGNKARIYTVRVFGPCIEDIIVSDQFIVETTATYDKFKQEAPHLRAMWALAKKDSGYSPSNPRSKWNMFDYMMMRTFGEKTDQEAVDMGKAYYRSDTLSNLDCLAHFRRLWGRAVDLTDDEDRARLANSILRTDSPLLVMLSEKKSGIERLELAKSITMLENMLNCLRSSPYPAYYFINYMVGFFRGQEPLGESSQAYLSRIMLAYMPGRDADTSKLSDQDVASAWRNYTRFNYKNIAKMNNDIKIAAGKAYEREFLSLDERSAMIGPPGESGNFSPESFYRDIFIPSTAELQEKLVKGVLKGADIREWVERVIKPVDPGFVFEAGVIPEGSVAALTFADAIRSISTRSLLPRGLIIDYYDQHHLSGGIVERIRVVATPAGKKIPLYEVRALDAQFEKVFVRHDRIIVPSWIDRHHSVILQGYREASKRLPRDYGLKHKDWAFSDWMRLRYLAKLPDAEDPVGIMRQPFIDSAISMVDTQAYAHDILGKETDGASFDDNIRLCEALLKPGSRLLARVNVIRSKNDHVLLSSMLSTILDMEAKLNSIRMAKSPAFCSYKIMIGSMESEEGIQLPPAHEFSSRMMFTLMAKRLFNDPTDDKEVWAKYLRGKAADIRNLGEELRKAAEDVYKTEFFSPEERAARLRNEMSPKAMSGRSPRPVAVVTKSAVRGPVAAGLNYNEDSAIRAERRDEDDLIRNATECLAARPVNVYIDLSVIPASGLSAEEANDELRANMRAMAYLVAAHKAKGLNIRYILEHDKDPAYKSAAEKILKDEISNLPVDTGTLVDSITNVPHKADNAMDISLKGFDKISAMKKNGAVLGDNQFIVALKDDTTTPGVALPNYSAAMSVGLALAALHDAKSRYSSDNYKQLKDKMLERISAIFMRFGMTGKDMKFSNAELELMVSGASTTKLFYALMYALPPAVKVAIERLKFFHETLELLLQAA